MKNTVYSPLAPLLCICLCQIVRADQIAGPLAALQDVNEAGQIDATKIATKCNNLLPRRQGSAPAGIAFTLYPNGSIKWCRPLQFTSDNTSQLNDTLISALKASTPLSTSRNLHLKKATAFALVLDRHRATPYLARYNAEVLGRYTYDGSARGETDDWLAKDTRIIAAHFRVPKSTKPSVTAVWTRVNEDGSLDDCQQIPIAGLGRSDSEVKLALCSALTLLH